ncbi:MAG: sulfite exporter TauE/SafE family protein [Planctomycetota bacterium]
MQFIELTILSWALVTTAALLVGLSKAGFGAGAGILAVPLMTIGLGSATEMLPVLLPVLIIGDIFSIIHYTGEKDWKNLLMLIPGCLLGVGGGWLALSLLGDLDQLRVVGTSMTGDDLLQRAVGIICVGFVLLQFWRSYRRSRTPDRLEAFRPRLWHGIGLGGAAGLTSTLAHSAGPLVALYLLPQKLDKRIFVGTTVTYFFIGNLIKLIPFTAEGLFTSARLWTSAILAPAVIVGTFVGVFLNRKLDDRVFVLIIYVLAMGAGLKLLLGL